MKDIKLKLLDSVKINGRHLDIDVRQILDAAKYTAPPLVDGIVWITSAADGKHKKGSKHYTNEAFDIRIKNVVGFKPKVKNSLVSEWAKQIQNQLGYNYDVIYGDKDHLDHIHVELQYRVPRKEFEYAWAAGFIEADGSFSLNVIDNKRKMIQPVIQITQFRKAPLERLYALFGGSISKNKNQTNREYWKLTIQGKKRIINCISKILPYLAHKTRQAELVAEAAQRQHSKGENVKYSDLEWEWFKLTKSEIIRLNALRYKEFDMRS